MQCIFLNIVSATLYNLLVLSSLSRTAKTGKKLCIIDIEEKKSNLYSQMIVRMCLRKNVFFRMTAANI